MMKIIKMEAESRMRKEEMETKSRRRKENMEAESGRKEEEMETKGKEVSIKMRKMKEDLALRTEMREAQARVRAITFDDCRNETSMERTGSCISNNRLL